MAAYLTEHGYSQADSTRAAYLHYYNQLGDQTRLLGFMDCFRFVGWFTLAVTPLVFLIRHFKVGGKAPAGH
jgi:DHA2 family multidrug resistance protein